MSIRSLMVRIVVVAVLAVAGAVVAAWLSTWHAEATFVCDDTNPVSSACAAPRADPVHVGVGAAVGVGLGVVLIVAGRERHP